MKSYLYEHGKKIILFHLVIFALGYLTNSFKLKLGSILSLFFCYWFFRIPEFRVVKDKNSIIAPSYGKVIGIEEKIIDGKPYEHIAVFISLFDPHIQYSPVKGPLTNMTYKKGTFYPAMFLKKTEHNERMVYQVETPRGKVFFAQIAGQIARTIVPFVEAGKFIDQGQEIGLIRFGSRCDVYIPKNRFKTMVKVGDYVKGGQSRLGVFV